MAATFPHRKLLAWIAAAVLCFGASAYFTLRGGGSGSPGGDAAGEAGANSFSRSAIGYAGLAEMLHRLDVPVARDLSGMPGKPGATTLLVIAEPHPDDPGLRGLPALLRRGHVLLILPKWLGRASQSHRGWIDRAVPAGLFEADPILRFVDGDGRVSERPEVSDWQPARLGRLPNLPGPVQVMRVPKMRVLIGSGEDALLGEIDRPAGPLWVLSDPDMLNNHGLAQAGNAEFAAALIDALLSDRPDGKTGGVVFDESVHGFAPPAANPFALAFRFPFSIATALTGIAVLLLLWATLWRFGAPETEGRALEPGKLGLLNSAARLLEFGGHQRAIIRRYVEATIDDAGRELHAPVEIKEGGMGTARGLDWLGEAAKNRGATRDAAAIRRRTTALAEQGGDPATLMALAREIHAWKGEITDGPARGSRRR